ncbi:predicted protein [Nematostella vectensis]|uniref:Complexin n=1 Tax=Nematostella vectensis TaxID=45351 RepID=A7SMF4_NEMVE|nr:predicted protein [Nematostella vectensis]|eukprot:XP_001627218.1 predicted protein [Nematostella vectensis]
MNPLTKALVTNKLSSVTKSIGLDDKDETTSEDAGVSSKEMRKMREKEEAERAKREEMYAKRNADREKKREQMRAKYGIQKDKDGPKKSGGHKEEGSDAPTRKGSLNREKSSEEDDNKCAIIGGLVTACIREIVTFSTSFPATRCLKRDIIRATLFDVGNYDCSLAKPGLYK